MRGVGAMVCCVKSLGLLQLIPMVQGLRCGAVRWVWPLLCLLFSGGLVSLQGQELPRGYPLLRYFSPASYRAGDQNWAFAQDQRGLVYIGNDGGGLLEYDGARFQAIALSDRLVRSLTVGADGIIYIGLTHDFGRVVPDAKGQLVYESLLPTVEDSVPVFPTVFRTFALGDEVVFCAQTTLFIYNIHRGTTRALVPDAHAQFFAHKVGNKLFGWTARNRPFIYQHDTLRWLELHLAPGLKFDLSANHQLYGAVSVGDARLLLALHPVGLCYYDTLSQELARVAPEFAPALQAQQAKGALVYAMRSRRNGRIGTAVLFSDVAGYAEFDVDGTHEELYGKVSGLDAAGVTDFGESFDGGLWLMHQIGFSCLEPSSPLRSLGEKIGVSLHPYALAVHDGQLYLGTNRGVQRVYQQAGTTKVESLAGANDRIWQLVSYTDPYTRREILLARGNKRCYEVRGDSLCFFEFGDGTHRYLPGYALHPMRYNDSMLYVGTNHWLVRLRRLPHGRWMVDRVGFSQSVLDDVRVLDEAPDSTLYASTYTSGVYALFGAYGDTCRVENLGTRAAVDLQKAMVKVVDSTVYLQTDKGLYYYDPHRDTVLPAPLPLAPCGGVSMMQLQEGHLLVQRYGGNPERYWMEYYHDLQDTAGAIVRTPFRRLQGQCQGTLMAPGGVLYLGYSQAVHSYDPSDEVKLDFPFRAFVRGVYDLRADTLLFGGAYGQRDSHGVLRLVLEQPSSMQLSLPYAGNSLRFVLGSNCYTGGSVQYQWRLTANDAGWSAWSSVAEVVYTNLPIGRHTLRVRARDAYGRLSREAHYSFTIRPPYYLTWFAFVLYAFFLLAALFVVVRWRNRRFRRARRMLEALVAMRTEEVENQKARIQAQNEQIMASISYAATMQQAVLPSLLTVRALFPDSFVLYLPRDMVSGDFYWVTQQGHRRYCCIADCTGHGVPGGFMSMMAITTLQQVCSDRPEASPGELLGAVRHKIIEVLHQRLNQPSNQDGFDCALFTLEAETGQVCYAGARIPLLQVHAGEPIVHEPDRMPVGIHALADRPFTTHTFTVSEGDMLYAYSDGYIDQFGGSEGRRYTSFRLRKLLRAISALPSVDQRARLLHAHYSWRGDHGQIDDILVFGTCYHARASVENKKNG